LDDEIDEGLFVEVHVEYMVETVVDELAHT
jgi:hypothetical protein